MTAHRHPAYRGRFAPSPTGPLHFGSLVAAVASYVDARAHAGRWLVRMEDLDWTREIPGAADHILATLRAFGFAWDEPVIHQRDRTGAYQAALARLATSGLTYDCGCSRSDIARAGRPGIEGPIYPGTCRGGHQSTLLPRSIRLRTDNQAIAFIDRIQGPQEQRIEETVGDFVLRRADGIHAYQLAVVVDDAWQQVTRVVRGADLLMSTPRQILIQRALHLPQPSYAHVPLMVDAEGRKLSKSFAAAPVDPGDPLPALKLAWDLLGQETLSSERTLAGFWKAAVAHWRMELVPSTTTLSIAQTQTI
jgi:glutamyl-Q tRNA(Asp) synthetase